MTEAPDATQDPEAAPDEPEGTATTDDPAAPMDPAAPSAAGGAAGGAPVHGQLSTRVRGRFTGSEEDVDLQTMLSLDARASPDARVSWHVLGQATADLDGTHEAGGEFVLYGLDETYDSAVTAQLYHAYADVHDVNGLAWLRAGRQLHYETPELAWFDGVGLETRPRGEAELAFGLMAGIPVTPYESSPEGDRLLGIYATARPWSGGRARLDWMHLEDENVLGPHDDDLLAIGLWQRAGERLSLEAAHSRVESLARDLRLAARWFDATASFGVDATYYELLEPQVDLATPIDPFTSALFQLEPYRQVALGISKGVGEHVHAQAGGELRRVTHEDDVGDFNHEYERWHANLSFADLLAEGASFSLSIERWDADGSAIDTWGADLRGPLDERLTAALGSYFALYEYDAYLAEEQDQVRTTYAELDWSASASARWRLRYELEHDDDRTIHTVRVASTWRF